VNGVIGSFVYCNRQASTITGNSLQMHLGSGASSPTVAAIVLDNGNGSDFTAADNTGTIVANNTILGGSLSGHPSIMTYGIQELTGNDFNICVNNHITGALTAEVIFVGANTKKRFARYQFVVLPVKAGAAVDGDFVFAVDGLMELDSTNSKIWVRMGGVWKGVVVA